MALDVTNRCGDHGGEKQVRHVVTGTAAGVDRPLRGDEGTGRLAAVSGILRPRLAVSVCGAIPAMPHVSD
jgi:hypothetical protein